MQNSYQQQPSYNQGYNHPNMPYQQQQQYNMPPQQQYGGYQQPYQQQQQYQPQQYQQPQYGAVPNASPWRAATAADGQVYYYNQITQETQWDKPPGML